MGQSYGQLYQKSYEMRKRFLEIFTKLGYGHLTTAFSETEILIALLSETMNFHAGNVNDKNRDRLVLSKGHGAGMLFPVFEDLGILSKEEIEEIIKCGGDFTKNQRTVLPGI